MRPSTSGGIKKGEGQSKQRTMVHNSYFISYLVRKFIVANAIGARQFEDK